MKYSLLVVCIVALLACGSCASQRPINPFGMVSPVEQRIRTWQTDNNLELSEKAFQLLVKQAEGNCENCTTTYHYQRVSAHYPSNPSERASTKVNHSVNPNIESMEIPASEQMISGPITPPTGELRYELYDYYLDQLRDIRRSIGKGLVIEASDIMAYSFTTFLRDIGFSDGAMGRLIVQSRPSTAGITINGKRKGFTNKRFVVQAGNHRVEVHEPTLKLSCDTTITVDESETKTVVCEPPS